MKKYLHVALSTLLVSACSNPTTTSDSSSFSIQAKNTDNSKPSTVPSNRPSEIEKPPLSPPKSGEIIKRTDTVPEDKPRFDMVPTHDPKDALPGSITVLYKNAYQMRVDKSAQRLSSGQQSAQREINELLERHNVKMVSDLAYPGVSDAQLDRDVQAVYDKYGVEAPHRKSIHVYQFSKDVDTKKLAENLRKLPYVVTAYMTPQFDFAATVTQLSHTNLTSSLSAPGNDDRFDDYPQSDWWWFNRHKVFHGWGYYDLINTPMPKIAIIDSGFDTRNGAPDKPNYQGGTSIKFDATCPRDSDHPRGECLDPWIVGSNVFELPDDNPRPSNPSPSPLNYYSHGALVASIAASPQDNEVGYAGVAPGATIIPYKIVSYEDLGVYYLHENAIANAIFQSSFSDADVISLSMAIVAPGSGSDAPIIRSPAVYNEVLTASVSGKSVVIAAGNSGVNIDNSNLGPTSPLPYCECIIVGASEDDPDNAPFHSKAWLDSNFGQKVDISAAGANVRGSTFWVRTGDANYYQSSGTSLSVPMVSAAVGMMRKIAQANGGNLTPLGLKNLVIHSSTSSRFSTKVPGGVYFPETKFLGKGLSGVDWITTNSSSMVGIRELNLYNALVMAKNSHQYQAMARVHNVDDFIWMSINWDWSNYYQSQFGDDRIYGINGVFDNDVVSFSTYNASVSAYAYGYQVYKGSQPVFDYMGGVAYVTGIQENSNFPVGWHQTTGYSY